MAAPVKKRAVNISSNFSGKNAKSESSDESSEDIQENITQEKIQVDFEGRSPVDADFHGIKQLLQQLFLKAHVNLSELAELIIRQNYVGSVVKQSEVDAEDSDDDDDDDDSSDVFGVMSVLNITEKQNLECVQQLRSLLLDLCSEHATDQTNTLIRSLLSDDSQSIGLLINERIINIPAQISVPLLESLSKEIKNACRKKMPYDFTYFILICKLYKSEKPHRHKKKKQLSGGGGEPEILWSNPEEELINQEADCQFEFCVKDDADSGLSGCWMEDDVEMSPYRRVLLLQANKLDPLIERIKTFLTQQQ
jgi:protein BCP1